MSTHSPQVRRRAVAAALPAALLTGLVATGSPASADKPPPPINVVVTGATNPFYGDALSLKVSPGGEDLKVSVREGDTTIFGPVPMVDSPMPVTIPTLDRFRAGTSHTLTFTVTDGELRTGTESKTITPRFIPSDLEPAGFSVEYGLPLYGRLDATIPTAVKPGGGTMALKRGGAVKARYAIRTDGTYALYDPTMTPGTYPDVSFYYEGDQSYAAQALGTGLVTHDVVVSKQHTTTVAAPTAAKVTQGDPVEVLASTTSSNTASVVDPAGVMTVYASSDGQHFDKVTDLAYPGGKQQVRLPLTEWARTHVGFWTLRTVFTAGDGVSEDSSSTQDSRLQVVAPGTPVDDTSTALTLSSATTTVQTTTPVTATASVTSGSGAVKAGDVQFTLRGQVVATAPVGADGTATAKLTPAVVGESLVKASYVGTPDFGASASPALPLTAAKAATTTTATVPAQPAAPGSVLPLQVKPTGSTVAPTGSVVVSEGTTTLGSVAANGGQAQLRLPVLSAGAHQLTVSYGGDASTEPSRTTVTYTVGAGTGPTTKAAAAVTAKVKKVKQRKAKVKVTVGSTAPVTGTVQLLRGTKVVATGTVKNGKVTLLTKKLPRGRSTLVARYLGSDTVAPSDSSGVQVRVR